LGILLVLVILVAGLVVYIQLRWDRTFDVPEPALAASTDPAIVEHGQYLSEAVAGCRACHTEIDQMDGSFIGPEYGGGVAMEVEGSPGTVLVSNNITTDPKSGWMHGIDEEDFVDRFRGGGPSADGSHMPWAGYERMSDVDLAALYVFLKELPPVDHDPGPIVQKAE
jgi:hypothetical protein